MKRLLQKKIYLLISVIFLAARETIPSNTQWVASPYDDIKIQKMLALNGLLCAGYLGYKIYRTATKPIITQDILDNLQKGENHRFVTQYLSKKERSIEQKLSFLSSINSSIFSVLRLSLPVFLTLNRIQKRKEPPFIPAQPFLILGTSYTLTYALTKSTTRAIECYRKKIRYCDVQTNDTTIRSICNTSRWNTIRFREKRGYDTDVALGASIGLTAGATIVIAAEIFL